MIALRIGYVPLTDAAVLIVAAERGFARRHGLALTLEREPSWATLRDKLALGVVDAAHILAPLAIATSLGLSPGGSLPLVAPFALNLNGNAITVSTALWSEIAQMGPTGTVQEVATALGRVIRDRQARGAGPLTLATVFPFSTHTLQLRAFLASGGVDSDRDLRITVVPPPYTVDALRSGAVEGFCVGSPWNSVAVEAGIGRIAALGCAITPDAPEKVLAWPRNRLPPEDARAVVASLIEAAEWCADPANREALALLLAEPRHLNVDAAIIRRTLDGRLLVDPSGTLMLDPGYLRLGGRAHRPDPAHALWMHDRMAEAGQITGDAATRRRAADVYDPSIYDSLQEGR